MGDKRLKNKVFFAATAATVICSYVCGKGIFNKQRFKEQHEALGAYVEGNYPGCTYAPIAFHGKGGWSSVIKRFGRTVAFVYFSKSADGIYVFTETKQKLNK